MNWISTPKSSNVAGFGYDESAQILTVEFTSGARYNYYDVPESVFQEMSNAASKGRFLAQWVKGSYRYARI